MASAVRRQAREVDLAESVLFSFVRFDGDDFGEKGRGHGKGRQRDRESGQDCGEDADGATARVAPGNILTLT